MTSLCLHATSERWKQRQDQAERARPHFPQQRRHVLQPADASTAPPPSRRGVSLLCAAQGSLTVHGCHLTPEALWQDEKCLTLVLLLVRRPASELYSMVNLPTTKPVSQSADLPQNKLKFEPSDGRFTTAVFFTLVKMSRGFSVNFSVIHIKKKTQPKLISSWVYLN